MDKQDYRTKLDEVQRLIVEGDKEDAFYILDGMNWRKVHNVNALLAASQIYEDEGHYEQARELLEMAHERSPIGRMIIYRLALLCIRLESYAEAREYYDEFVDIAPHDSLKYIIQYQLAKAQGAEDITLISILEELKEHDFLEEWAYELALLYHKTGQVDKCISTCDQIILYYGEGIYVENALELKMIYQPLDENQESKYKTFRKRKDNVIEVRPGEEFGGNGEILSHPVKIPEIAISNDRFNTQNLQAEIKRNIEEIMQATETGTVSENMEAIKELVEDIPYAKITKDPTGPMEEVSIKKEEARRIDDTLKSHFREYLQEEYDGQMSFNVPYYAEAEPQIAGQMTIDQIMSDWQKTARAAEQALSEAEELRLENAKAKAIEEANQIIARLEEAKRELDAGVSPRDLLRNEYLSDIPTQGQELARRFTALKEQLGAPDNAPLASKAASSPRPEDTRFLPAGARATAETIKTLEKEGPDAAIRRYATKRIDKPSKEEKEALKNQSTFKIPKIGADTGRNEGVGFEVPIVNSAGEPVLDQDQRQRHPSQNASRSSKPSSEVSKQDAAKIMADVNNILQREIDRAREQQTGPLPKIDLSTALSPDQTQAFAEAVVRILNEQAKKEEPAAPSNSNSNVMKAETVEIADSDSDKNASNKEEILTADDEKPQQEVKKEPESNESETLADLVDSPDSADSVDPTDSVGSTDSTDGDDKDDGVDRDEPESDEAELEESFEEPESFEDDNLEISEEQFADAIYDDLPQTELTDEEREIFTYFTPISGMEAALCQVLTGVRARMMSEGKTSTGNIIIQGGEGTGKTTLATNLITVLQNEVGRPGRNVGRIDGERLNTKDLSKLFSKIRGGALIVERAGDITRDTALELSAQMEQDESGILVILEDARIGIERVMALNPMFSRRFTEKIVIPVLSIDELVNFGKAYAIELGYSIDEMGVLALYDRINLIQRTDHPTNLTEVKEIIDEAIDAAEGGGIRGFLGRFGGRHFDSDGNLILQEKDFQGK